MGIEDEATWATLQDFRVAVQDKRPASAPPHEARTQPTDVVRSATLFNAGGFGNA